MKKQIFHAYTLAEALISFTLAGIIFVATVSSFHKKDNYTKLYYQAFNTLYQASQAIKEEWDGSNDRKCACENDWMVNETCYNTGCWRNSANESKCTNGDDCKYGFETAAPRGGSKNIERDFPGFLYVNSMTNAMVGYGQDKEFCEKFVEKINTYPTDKCISFISLTNTEKIGQNSSRGGVNFFDAFRSGTIDEDGNFVSTNEDEGVTPTFTASNGQQFYMSSPVSANFPEYEGSYKHAKRESYRFVVVDLNGNSKPNTQFKKGDKYPDLVLFAITSEGDVIPLGLPEFSRAYISALVYYPSDLNSDGSPICSQTKSEPMTLWSAKGAAWGRSATTLHEAPYGNPVTQYEYKSQSSKMYYIAANCLAKNCENLNAAKNEQYADDLYVNLILQFLFKNEGAYTPGDEFYDELRSANTIYKGDNGCECKSVEKESDMPTCGIDFQN